MTILHFRYQDRRRTMRVLLSVPLKVMIESDSGELFSLHTRSHTVSGNGGSIELDAVGIFGKKLILENRDTREAVESKVVSMRRARDGKTYVGIEFTKPGTNFWHMAFPVSGARPMRRINSSKASA